MPVVSQRRRFIPYEGEGRPMPRRTIRLTSATDERIESAAKLGGYSSPSAFLRAAINKELGHGREGLGRAEEQIVASILEVRQDVRRIERAQQAPVRFSR